MAQKFAFALGKHNKFNNRHFGDSDVFRLYQCDENGHLVFEDEVINPFKNFDESQKHGARAKGSGIIEFLKEQGVEVIVSRQFGPNIKMVHQHFIPIKIGVEAPDEVLLLLEKNMKWIAEEWHARTSHYHLFTLQNGIVKMTVKEEK